jgi:hypothetical protein
MAVSWNTYTSLPDEEAVVYFGTDAWDLDRTAPARESTFETSRTFSRHAILADLKPGTEYHYRVAHTNCFGCSTIPTYSFTTARAAGDCTPYAVAIVADMGLMGPDGLTNSTGEGAGGALLDDETNTIQSMVQSLDAYEHIGGSAGGRFAAWSDTSAHRRPGVRRLLPQGVDAGLLRPRERAHECDGDRGKLRAS